MTKNVGSADRAVRLIAALGLVVIVFVLNLSTALEAVLLIVAAILAVTSMVRMCPLYRLFGFSTCSLD